MLTHFEIVTESVEFPSLRGNPAGDPWIREVAAIVPKGAGGVRAQDSAAHPVVILLAGYAGTGPMMLNRRAWVPSLPEQIDGMRERGEIGDLVVVLPDGFTVYGGSQYVNSTATGRYRDMITEDLIPWISRRFPASALPRHRAVAGKSSGGFGALSLAMDRPDLFAAAACHSGDMYFEYSYQLDFPRLLAQIGKRGSLKGFIEAFLAAPKKTGDEVLAMNIVAMAACYSPDPARPWRVALPFDQRTGEMDPDVWARWLEHDPVRRVDRCANALRGLRLLFLDCGSRDQFNLQYGLRILTERLCRLGIPHEACEFDDDHSDTSYRWDVSLPKIWTAIR